MKFKSSGIFAGAMVLGTVGCATIMHGTTQKVGISSSPTGATVTVGNKLFGRTPLFADLERGEEHIVTIEMVGYEKSQLTLTKSVSGWVWGNIVFGGLIGLGVDAISGGLYTLSPEQLSAELKKSGANVSRGNELTLSKKDRIIQSVRIGVPTKVHLHDGRVVLCDQGTSVTEDRLLIVCPGGVRQDPSGTVHTEVNKIIIDSVAGMEQY